MQFPSVKKKLTSFLLSEDKRLCDATAGNKARSQMVLTSNQVGLSALQTKALAVRFNEGKKDGSILLTWKIEP